MKSHWTRVIALSAAGIFALAGSAQAQMMGAPIGGPFFGGYGGYGLGYYGAGTTPASMEKLISFSNARMPSRLTEEQLDPAKGELKWPHILQRPEFAKQREALETLFVERAKRPYHTGLGTENYREVRMITDDMHDVLRSLIENISPDEFITGNKFLNSLSYEARFDPELSVVKQ
jgi:hypothetical protein